MATIYYRIISGTGPFTVSINPAAAPDNHHLVIGEYYFTNIPDDDYVVNIVDGIGCTAYLYPSVLCNTTTTTTTLCVPIELEILSWECDNLTTTTTTTEYFDVEACLEGLIIEAIYVTGHAYDQDLLPEGYVCPPEMIVQIHWCNLAFFEIYGNGIYLGDARMNNRNGVDGPISTNSGRRVCQDYDNTPSAMIGEFWTGSPTARYDKIILTPQQALDIANAGGGDANITFSLVPGIVTYGDQCDPACQCDGYSTPHDEVTWIRISKSNGEVVYNDCPVGEFFTFNVCGITTTSTTTIPPSTTTTTTDEPPTTTTTTTLEINTIFVYYDVLP